MKNSNNQTKDIVIIGGGIMGLMTAFYASELGTKVTIIEKLTIGNKKAASFSNTRSIRCDYIDPYYASMAFKSLKLWQKLQDEEKEKFLFLNGCLNIVKKSVTPGLKKTYAMRSYETLNKLGLDAKLYSKSSLNKKYPQFDADLATLDKNGGFLYLPVITKLLLKLLKNNNVEIIENSQVTSITDRLNNISVDTNGNKYTCSKLIVTSGIWTNEILKLIKKCYFQIPIILDRPKQSKYYILSKQKGFSQKNFPVFAYLDAGIYGHPVYVGKTKGLKIGFYSPSGITLKNDKINNIDSFIRSCMPSLIDTKSLDVTDADQCFYDITPDSNFVIGKLPGFSRIFVGTGWNGTGYKFAPIIGKILSDLAISNRRDYNLEKLSLERFL